MTTNTADPIDFVINYIQNVTKLYPVIIPAATLLYGVLSNNSLGLALTVFAIVTDIINNLVFKNISGAFYNRWCPTGDCPSVLLRPPTATNCGVFMDCNQTTVGSDAFKVGMPSGHAQLATAMTLLFILILAKNPTSLNIFYMCTMAVTSLWIIYSRVFVQCHTWSQVLVGSLLGYLLGLAGYYVLKYRYPDDFVEVQTNWQLFLPIVAYIVAIIFANL